MNRKKVFFLKASLLASVFGGALIALPLQAGAFNPDEDSNAAISSRAGGTTLPSTAPLINPMPRVQFPSVSTVAAPRVAPADNPSSAPQIPAQEIPAPAYAPAVAAAQPAPVFPPVDARTAALAQQTMQAQQPTTQGFVAPAPLITLDAPTTAAMTQPVAAPAPEPLADPLVLSAPAALPTPISPATVDTASISQPAMTENLSSESKRIIGGIPSHLDTPKPKKGGNLNVKRMSPEVQSLTADSKPETYDAVGLSIKVQRPGLDANYELNRAYTALMGGQNSDALAIYQNVLSSEPDNTDALFGAASIYQRTGDIEHARGYYARLLKIDPNHREGLNNFLALIGDEAPQEALAELERLEQRNPDFSPIPAQQALLLKKLGYADQARERLLRAIDLAPENLTYKYNLAILLDSQGHYTDAAALYRMLIDASLKGENIPSTVEILQKRLNFIAAAPAPAAQIRG